MARIDVQGSGSDVDMEGDDGEEQEVDIEEEDELEDEEQDLSDLDALSSPPEDDAPEAGPSGVPPRLRIKLKLPAQSSTSSLAATASATPTPDGRTRRRNIPRGSDIESEDDDDDDERSTRSASVATSTAHSRALTARQAVLANVVDSSHVSLIEPPNPRKKKPLTEIELALKREETARKRKNLSEKKLEDEKAETINRLLKKQSRSKTKRNALSTAEDRPTPLASGGNADANGDAEDETGAAAVIPSMYRWVSTTRSVGSAKDGERGMLLSFSVPVSILPQTTDTAAPPEAAMDVDQPAKLERPQCDVSGCLAPRKYRLVKDWQRGACGMVHLRILEAQLAQ